MRQHIALDGRLHGATPARLLSSRAAPLGWRDRSGWWREKGYLELVRVNAQRSRRRARGATALLGALVATALLISASSSRNDSCRTVSFTSAIRRRSYRALAPPNRSRVQRTSRTASGIRARSESSNSPGSQLRPAQGLVLGRHSARVALDLGAVTKTLPSSGRCSPDRFFDAFLGHRPGCDVRTTECKIL